MLGANTMDRHSAMAGPITDAGPSNILERLADSGFLDRGCVAVIGLDAIRDRLGSQWSVKRDLVWDAAERALVRKLPADMVCARISDVNFVISSGDEGGGCLSFALNVLRELLQFFLGVQNFEDMKISLVTAITNGEITSRPLDPRTIEALPIEAETSETHAAWPVVDTLSIQTASGQGLELAFECECLFNLRNHLPIATRVVPVARDQKTRLRLSDRWPQLLSAASLTKVNAANIAFVKRGYCQTNIGVLTACSIHALASPSNLAGVVRQLERVGQDVTKPIIFELTDIDWGTPQSRILTTVAALSPYCRKVVARVPMDKPPLEVLQGCRLSGLSLDCRLLQENMGELMFNLAAFVERTRSVTPLTFALGLNSLAACELAAAAGVTHGSREV